MVDRTGEYDRERIGARMALVLRESVTGLARTGTELQVLLNPNGQGAEYQFEQTLETLTQLQEAGDYSQLERMIGAAEALEKLSALEDLIHFEAWEVISICDEIIGDRGEDIRAVGDKSTAMSRLAKVLAGAGNGRKARRPSQRMIEMGRVPQINALFQMVRQWARLEIVAANTAESTERAIKDKTGIEGDLYHYLEQVREEHNRLDDNIKSEMVKLDVTRQRARGLNLTGSVADGLGTSYDKAMTMMRELMERGTRVSDDAIQNGRIRVDARTKFRQVVGLDGLVQKLLPIYYKQLDEITIAAIGREMCISLIINSGIAAITDLHMRTDLYLKQAAQMYCALGQEHYQMLSSGNESQALVINE